MSSYPTTTRPSTKKSPSYPANYRLAIGSKEVVHHFQCFAYFGPTQINVNLFNSECIPCSKVSCYSQPEPAKLAPFSFQTGKYKQNDVYKVNGHYTAAFPQGGSLCS